MNTFLSEQDIIDSIKIHYGIEIRTVELLSLGADINALIYKAITNSNRTYFVKFKRDQQQDKSIAIIELLQNAGIQQIIAPIKTIDGLLDKQIGEFVLLVYPFIEGQDGFSRDLTNEQWINLGKTLRKVHEIVVPPSIQDRIRRETFTTKWRDKVRSLNTHIGDVSNGDEAALNMLAVMKEKRSDISQLVANADELALQLQGHHDQFVLCHSDIHAGNVLISNEGSFYIVDWDAPIMAPRERDLMFIGAGVANVWNKPQEETEFYKGYGQTEIDVAMLAYYRQERIVEDIAEYADALLNSIGTATERAEMFKQFNAMFDPQGVVEIALKTHKDVHR